MSKEKTVYFLGAGASNGSIFGLPTMEGFFREDELALDDFSELREFTETIFPKILPGKLNLEDVITYLELSIDRFGSFGKRPYGNLYSARQQFNQYVRRRLTYESVDDKNWCPRFEKIFRGLGKNDTIITLNYDLVIDHTLEAVAHENSKRDKFLWRGKLRSLLCPPIYANGRMGVYVDEREWESGWYLKLHGSIDWCYCPNPNCLSHQIMNVFSGSSDDGTHVCSSCGSSIEMAIVPPTMHKAFGKYPKLGVIWSIAHQELIASSSIVFIGVSFRPSDYYLSWLMKSSCLKTKNRVRSVVVVDKCESAVGRIEQLIGVKLKPDNYYSTLESYISSMSSRRCG